MAVTLEKPFSMPSLWQRHLAKNLNVCETPFQGHKVTNILAVSDCFSYQVHMQNMSTVPSQKQLRRTTLPVTAPRPYGIYYIKQINKLTTEY